MTEVVKFSVISIIIGSVLLVQGLRNKVKYQKDEMISSIILSVIFMLMLSVDELLQALIMLGWSAGICVLYIGVVLFSSQVCLLHIIHYLGFKEISSMQRTLQVKRSSWILLCFITLVSIVCVLSTFPGVWTGSDVATVKYYVDEGLWNDWHPLGYLYFVKLCFMIYHSIYTVNIFQTVLWIIINASALLFLRKYSINRKPMIIYTMLSIFVFSHFYYLQIMYKDVVFSMCLFATTIFLLYFISKRNVKTRYLVLGILSMMGVFIFRHAGNIPILVTLCMMIIYFLLKKNKKKATQLVGMMIVLIGISKVITIFGFQILGAEHKPEYVAFSNPIYMLSAASYEKIEFDQEDTAILEKVMPVEEWGTYYTKYWVDDVTRTWGKIGEEKINQIEYLIKNDNWAVDIIKINAKLFLHHPIFYVRQLLDASSIVWEIATPNDGGDWAAVTTAPSADITYSKLYEVTHGYGMLLHTIPCIKSMVWRGGFFFFVIILAGAILIIRKHSKEVFALVPVIVVDVLLMATTPAQDPRYILGTIEIGIFLIAYLFTKQSVEEEDNEIIVKDMKKDVGVIVTLSIVVIVVLSCYVYKIHYDETIFQSTEIVFDDRYKVPELEMFPETLFYDDHGVWFDEEYTMEIPNRINRDLLISFEGYCCAGDEVIDIYVNGQYAGTMEKEDPEFNQTIYFCEVSKSFFKGENQAITFKASPSIALLTDDGETYYGTFYAKSIKLWKQQ